MIIIGIDPDSEANGVAVYRSGKLAQLYCLDTMQFFHFVKNLIDTNHPDTIKVHIENVRGISAAFTARDKKKTQAVKLKMAQHIGMCKQSQIEIERVCKYLGVQVFHHPVSSKWKNEKAQFEKVTGWKKQSNEDKRSAAYLGYVGVLKTGQSS